MIKKTLHVIAVILIASLLTSCEIAGALWMEGYRIKGGYYDRPHKTKTNTSTHAR